MCFNFWVSAFLMRLRANVTLRFVYTGDFFETASDSDSSKILAMGTFVDEKYICVTSPKGPRKEELGVIAVYYQG